MGVILITRPTHDDTVNYLYHWSEGIVFEALKKDFEVVDLKNENANSKRFESSIASKNPLFIFLNGHGSPSAVFGHKDELLISIETDANLFKEKIIYARSCDAGIELGPASIEKGATAFIGYSGYFVFPVDTNSIATPLKDRLAHPVLDVSNTIPLSIIKGNTIEDSIEKSKKRVDFWIEKFNMSESTPETDAILMSLKWNRDNLAVFGKSEAKL